MSSNFDYEEMTVDERFNHDVPEEDRESVMEMLSESAHIVDCHPTVVTIFERDRIDALNVRVAGIVKINGVEHSFGLTDGNMGGTELTAWN